jgi:hypothetical protein
MSDTPRTDADEFKAWKDGCNSSVRVVSSYKARQLERELAASQAREAEVARVPRERGTVRNAEDMQANAENERQIMSEWRVHGSTVKTVNHFIDPEVPPEIREAADRIQFFFEKQSPIPNPEWEFMGLASRSSLARRDAEIARLCKLLADISEDLTKMEVIVNDFKKDVFKLTTSASIQHVHDHPR